MLFKGKPIQWFIFLVILFMITTVVHGALVSGREPTGGKNQLTIDNTQGKLDALVVLGQPNWPNPICAYYIPKGESHTFDKMRPGVYDIYYILGKGWISSKKAFSQEIEVGKIDQPISLETKGYNTASSTAVVWDQKPYNDNSYVSEFDSVTVTLYPVLGGNIELIQINRDNFPKY